MRRVLIVEDDIALGDGVRLALQHPELEAILCRTLSAAREALADRSFHLLILDINLPDGSGLDLLRQLRRSSRVPVILLTANDMETDIVTGLESGADDYITKPFSLAVLRARVNAQLRRGGADAPPPDRAVLGPFSFDFGRMEFRKNGTPVELSKTEQKLLRLLVDNRGRTLPRAVLVDRVWTDGAEYVDENALSVTVKRLRDKLEDVPSKPQYLKTVYGIGYTWSDPSAPEKNMAVVDHAATWHMLGTDMLSILKFLLPAAALAALVLLWDRLRLRRVYKRLDDMLERAIQGSFQPEVFDESRLSAVEAKLAQYLAATASETLRTQEERDKIKSLIADISHQTKTPIANVLLYAQLLGEQPLPPEGRECLTALEGQTEKLRTLIDALVKTSRLETGVLTLHPRPADLIPELEDCAAQFAPRAAEKGIVLTLVPAEDPGAAFDPKWTAEAVCCLLDNAVKYTPPGGSVTVQAIAYELFCRINITDTGPGIPEAEQANIFQRFYRAPDAQDAEGVGIGLYLARQIAEGQGGYIRVFSKPGKGAKFSLFLPKAKHLPAGPRP